MPALLNIQMCIDLLKVHRKIFHSEADFQFALAWEIQRQYPDAYVRLEYHLSEYPDMHIDISVFLDNKFIPIELKYKTARLTTTIDNEPFNLKNHGAQDIGKYDCLKDIQRLEQLSHSIKNYEEGYVIWITNDSSYLSPPKRKNTIYQEFSIHNGASKSGSMKWQAHASAGSIKGREHPIHLKSTYNIAWKTYCDLGVKGGEFFYSVNCVSKTIR